MVTESRPPQNEASSPSSAAPSPSDAEAERVLVWASRQAAANARRSEGRQPKPLRPQLPPPPAADRVAQRRAADASEDRERAEKVRKLRELCNVPPRYRAAAGDAIDGVPVAVRAAYRARLDRLFELWGRPGIVALLGHRGAGKTHMACALVNRFCGEGRYAMYAEAMDYFLALQESYADGSKVAASKVEAQYLRPELLVLDAMEERADTPWNDRMLVRLINKRYAAELSTVLISNETEDQFVARVGDTISDRIFDGGRKIACTWTSLRGQIADGGGGS